MANLVRLDRERVLKWCHMIERMYPNASCDETIRREVCDIFAMLKLVTTTYNAYTRHGSISEFIYLYYKAKEKHSNADAVIWHCCPGNFDRTMIDDEMAMMHQRKRCGQSTKICYPAIKRACRHLVQNVDSINAGLYNALEECINACSFLVDWRYPCAKFPKSMWLHTITADGKWVFATEAGKASGAKVEYWPSALELVSWNEDSDIWYPSEDESERELESEGESERESESEYDPEVFTTWNEYADFRYPSSSDESEDESDDAYNQ